MDCKFSHFLFPEIKFILEKVKKKKKRTVRNDSRSLLVRTAMGGVQTGKSLAGFGKDGEFDPRGGAEIHEAGVC